MGQHLTLGVVCLGLVLGGIACAPKWVGPTAGAGYVFSVQVSNDIVWLGAVDAAVAARYPQVSTVSVEVRDSQGRPADTVPVTFALEPDWASSATLAPAETRTRGGRAQAVFSEPHTIGVVRILVRVDGTLARVTLTVQSYEETSNNWSVRKAPSLPHALKRLTAMLPLPSGRAAPCADTADRNGPSVAPEGTGEQTRKAGVLGCS